MMTTTTTGALVAVLLSFLDVARAQGGCCFWPQSADRCASCESYATDSNYCASSRAHCEDDCGHVWCDDGAPGDDDGDDVSAGDDEDASWGPEWVSGTYTTGYWDCCKPSCAWNGKGSVDQPVRSCAAETGETLSDVNAASVCDGGIAASCADHQPFDYAEGVSMGFAAAAVGGVSGLDGDSNCGQCYELRFTDDEFSWGGGAHADIVGRAHVVQVTNIGYDVSGDHSFDLQIPGAGQGIFDTGCPLQFPGFASGDFDCDNNYGGCDDAAGCARLPEDLRRGCEWRYSASYRWLAEGGRTNNPFVRFRRVKCPAALVALSGTTPLDDDAYPEFDGNATTFAPTSAPPAPAPTAAPNGEGGGGAADDEDDDVETPVETRTKKKTTLDRPLLYVAVAMAFLGGVLCACAALAAYLASSSSATGSSSSSSSTKADEVKAAREAPGGDDDAENAI